MTSRGAATKTIPRVQSTNKSVSRLNSRWKGLTNSRSGRVIGFLIPCGLVNIHVSRRSCKADKVDNPLGKNRISVGRRKQKKLRRSPRGDRNVHLDLGQGLPRLRRHDLGLLGDLLRRLRSRRPSAFLRLGARSRGLAAPARWIVKKFGSML